MIFANFRPCGARRSTICSFLPLKPVMFAALDRRPFDFLSRSCAAGPSLRPSSAKTTTTPSDGAVPLTKDKLARSLTKKLLACPRLSGIDRNGVPSVGPEALTDAVLQQRREITAALRKTCLE